MPRARSLDTTDNLGRSARQSAPRESADFVQQEIAQTLAAIAQEPQQSTIDEVSVQDAVAPRYFGPTRSTECQVSVPTAKA
jgi:hypothetical protein